MESRLGRNDVARGVGHPLPEEARVVTGIAINRAEKEIYNNHLFFCQKKEAQKTILQKKKKLPPVSVKCHAERFFPPSCLV